MAGAIGPCSSLNKKGANVAETAIGQVTFPANVFGPDGFGGGGVGGWGKGNNTIELSP